MAREADRVVKTCEQCKEEVVMLVSQVRRKQGEGFYCSKECRVKAGKWGRSAVERVDVRCFNCGAEFQMRATDLARRKTGRVFCSQECLRKVGAKPRTNPDYECELCGKLFRKVGRAEPRFCSKTCYDKWQARHRVEQRCEECGKPYKPIPSQVRYGNKYCSRECYKASRFINVADRPPHNGKPVRLLNGYVYLWEPDHPDSHHNGWIAEHRLVAEKTLGRRLTRDEEVNHINRNKQDNRPENLSVHDNKTHAQITMGQRESDRVLLARFIEKYGPLSHEDTSQPITPDEVERLNVIQYEHEASNQSNT